MRQDGASGVDLSPLPCSRLARGFGSHRAQRKERNPTSPSDPSDRRFLASFHVVIPPSRAYHRIDAGGSGGITARPMQW